MKPKLNFFKRKKKRNLQRWERLIRVAHKLARPVQLANATEKKKQKKISKTKKKDAKERRKSNGKGNSRTKALLARISADSTLYLSGVAIEWDWKGRIN